MLETRALLGTGLLVVLLCGYLTYLVGAFPDDALIYTRYVKNALDGKGLVYNPGERYNALTSPLFSYATLIAASVIGDAEQSHRILHTLFLSIAAWLCSILLREQLSLGVLVALPLSIASCRYFYTTVGMETPLFLLLIVLALYFFQREKYGCLGLVCAGLLLTRGESIFLLLILAVAHFLRSRRFPSPSFMILPAVILLIHYSFNRVYYGEFLPSTLMAKIHHGESGLFPRWQFLDFYKVAYGIWEGDNTLVALLVLCALAGFLGNLRNRIVWILLTFLAAYILFFVVLKIPGYHWYYGPLFFSFYLFAGLGMETIWRTFANSGKPWDRRAGTGLAILMMGYILWAQIQHTYAYRGWKTDREEIYLPVANWLREHSPPEASVACSEIGFIGLYSDRYIIDMLGLVNPGIAKSLAEGDYSGWLAYDPDYVLVHVPIVRIEKAIEPLIENGTYAPVEGARFQNLSLLRRVRSREEDRAEG